MLFNLVWLELKSKEFDEYGCGSESKHYFETVSKRH